MQDAIKQVFPLEDSSKNQEKRRDHPWITKMILKEIDKRDKLKLKWINSGRRNNSDEHKIFKKHKNKVTNLTRNAKQNYLLNKCKEANGNSDKLWKVAKQAMNINPKPDVIPDFIRTVSASGDSSKVVDKNNIANEMNKEFSNMGANLAEKLETTSAHFSDFLQYPNPHKDRLILHSVTELEVSTLIDELDVSKSVGIDEIPPKILGVHRL